MPQGKSGTLPGLTIQDVRYVKNVQGRPVWILQARSAAKDDESGVVTGTGVELTFFKKGRECCSLRADRGEAHVKDGFFRVWGDVVVRSKDQDILLETSELFYREKENLVFTHKPVRFQASRMLGRGTGLRYSLSEGRIVIERQVTATVEYE